jgi:hypothetical protein
MTQQNPEQKPQELIVWASPPDKSEMTNQTLGE